LASLSSQFPEGFIWIVVHPKEELLMTDSRQPEMWTIGSVYEPYVGRWSRLVAQKFLAWLAVPPNKRWLDVGCGTGALTQTVLKEVSPAFIRGIDRSEDYVDFARSDTHDERAEFAVGDAQSLPVDSAAYEVTISGLMMNFIPDQKKAVEEMMRATKSGGTVALYVWDYAGKMQLMRHFWNAATALNPAAHELDEGVKSPICNPQALTDLFTAAKLKDVEVRAIDVDTDFKDFDDYWQPFLAGHAPAPRYAMSLSEEKRIELRERIRSSLPFALDGSIPLVARAWAVRGVR
jgi:SAM-dependent methyltransferase